jgi:hypothetical protein
MIEEVKTMKKLMAFTISGLLIVSFGSASFAAAQVAAFPSLSKTMQLNIGKKIGNLTVSQQVLNDVVLAGRIYCRIFLIELSSDNRRMTNAWTKIKNMSKSALKNDAQNNYGEAKSLQNKADWMSRFLAPAMLTQLGWLPNISHSGLRTDLLDGSHVFQYSQIKSIVEAAINNSASGGDSPAFSGTEKTTITSNLQNMHNIINSELDKFNNYFNK